MLPRSLNREFAFSLNDAARMLRTYADYRGAQFGVTRAQWAVLVRLDRFEGLKQSELAEMLDLQPITLTRLLDRLCNNGLIERRSDPNDRRAKRLFLTAAARPMLEQLGALGEDMMTTALAGVSRETVEQIEALLPWNINRPAQAQFSRHLQAIVQREWIDTDPQCPYRSHRHLAMLDGLYPYKTDGLEFAERARHVRWLTASHFGKFRNRLWFPIPNDSE